MWLASRNRNFWGKGRSLVVLSALWALAVLGGETRALADNPWPMAGANPERTSWSPEEVSGPFELDWYRPLEPYISQNVQLIAADGLIFVATARGLYALDAFTGDVAWIYSTELPLGHSPTYDNGVLYVGGFDRRLHCVDAASGARLWTFDEAQAGYRVNPLVADGLVIAGNRDGWLYAVHAHGSANAGQLAWKFATEGPILYSAAYRDGVVFVASQDMHVYALNSLDGTLHWQSDKVHGAGFHSFWPVLWNDLLVLTTRPNYRNGVRPGVPSLETLDPDGNTHLEFINGVERDALFPEFPPEGTLIGAEGNAPGDWVSGTATIDMTRAIDYLTANPWRQSQVFLRQSDGTVYEHVSPFVTTGTKNGTHAPPMVSGFDGVIYQQTVYKYSRWIAGGQIAGWSPGSQHASLITHDHGAADEPHIASGGGKYLYWSLCADRESGAIDLSLPLDHQDRGEWSVFWAYNLHEQAPGYDVMWFDVMLDPYPRLVGSYGSENGIYHNHTNDQNPFVPYEGRLYIHRSNAILAFGSQAGVGGLPLAPTPPLPADDPLPTLGRDDLRQRLAEEITKWLDAGHLHTGYFNAGQLARAFDSQTDGMEFLNDYFRHSGEDLWVLLRALPHTEGSLHDQLRSFIQQEHQDYSAVLVRHLGWQAGASRDWFLYPPEVADDMQQNDDLGVYEHYQTPFMNIYALWKYAEEFGDAATLFAAIRDRLPAPPTPDPQYVWAVNAAIAGHLAYLALEQLAGEPESTAVRSALDDLLAWRVDNFSKDSPFEIQDSLRRLNISHNFIHLTPELADHLAQHALSLVNEAVEEYEQVAPYWFVSRYEGCQNEGTIAQIFDPVALFQAKAWILGQSREELQKFLDVPGFARGDVNYLHNLISAIEAPSATEIVATPEIDPPGGNFAAPVTVTIQCATPGAAIHYTTDGNEVTPDSPRYDAPLTISRNTTLHARAYLDGLQPSGPASAVFYFGDPDDASEGCGCQTNQDGFPVALLALIWVGFAWWVRRRVRK